ncbi:MAG: pyridoxamine 5'-phosphate oxidase family protein [Comamonas sp.]
MIQTVAQLEALVGPIPEAAHLKVIDHLDGHAQRWLAASPLAFAGFSSGPDVRATLVGGAPGFAQAVRGGLRLPRAALDDPALPRPGQGCGWLFLVPGLGETLRINGRVIEAGEQEVAVAVDECYMHCAKAILRSDFWRPDAAAATPDTTRPTTSEAADGHAGWLRQAESSRFMGWATADARGRTDLSPKGDPAGVLVQVVDGDLCFADRPGNHRMDSVRNLLEQPRAAAVLLVPGNCRVAVVSGVARIVTDPHVRARFAVQGREPRLVTRLAVSDFVWRTSAALVRAAPWTDGRPPPDLDAAAAFAAHVKLNWARGWQAALARGMVSIPGLMRKGLEQDYKRNLY